MDLNDKKKAALQHRVEELEMYLAGIGRALTTRQAHDAIHRHNHHTDTVSLIKEHLGKAD